MPDFFLERAFAAPLTPAVERSLMLKLNGCAHEHRSRVLECLVDVERQRVFCRFEAQDLRAARAAARCSGLEPASPLDSGSGLEPEATWLSAAREPAADAPLHYDTNVGLVDVVAERRLDGPAETMRLAAEYAACTWCLDTFRVVPGPLALSADGRRVLLLFRAPDAEAVRMAYRHSDVSFDRVVALRRIEHPSVGHSISYKR